MKTLKCVAIFSLIVFVSGPIFAQKTANEGSKHEIRLAFSDALPLKTASILGVSITDALSGSKRGNITSPGMFSVGYRYQIDRFRVGADVAYFLMDSKLKMKGEATNSLRDKSNSFLLLPTGEFQYFKSGIVELYGSASAGVMYTSAKYTALTDAGEAFAKKTPSFNDVTFAFQANPIALRLGTERVGGFVEAGIGYKGFLNFGVNVRF